MKPEATIIQNYRSRPTLFLLIDLKTHYPVILKNILNAGMVKVWG